MKGAIDRAERDVAETGQLDAAAVRQSRQRRGPWPHDGAGNTRDFRRRAARCVDHRRRHRRPHHRLRRSAQEGMARASRCSRSSRRCRRSSPAAQPGPHPIQGIGANFIPSILDTGILDGVIDVDADDAKDMARRAAREEGMLIGISSGAALAAIAQKLPELGDKPRILAFNYDTGERYLSVSGLPPGRELISRRPNRLAAALTTSSLNVPSDGVRYA